MLVGYIAELCCSGGRLATQGLCCSACKTLKTSTTREHRPTEELCCRVVVFTVACQCCMSVLLLWRLLQHNPCVAVLPNCATQGLCCCVGGDDDDDDDNDSRL